MTNEQLSDADARIHVRNIGCIEETEVTFEGSVSILTGRNATNRTSLLEAIMAALGSDQPSLKADAETGAVTLELGCETYTRELERTGDGVSFSGDPYLVGPELADLFAFLLESNETRRTVAFGGDLREIIMRPVDADSIETQIHSLQTERSEIENEIERRESLKETLTALKQERVQLSEEIDDLAATLSDLDEQIEAVTADIEALEEEGRSEVLAVHREVNQFEIELERLRDERERTARSPPSAAKRSTTLHPSVSTWQLPTHSTGRRQ